VPVTSLVEPDALPAFEKIAKDCIQSFPQFEHIEKDESPLQHEQFLKINPTTVEPGRSMMLDNTPGRAPAGAPVFIAQGTADTTVNPDITKRFGEALCAQGARVSFVELPGVTHTFAAKDSAPQALRWMTDRFRGVPAPSDCER
jgi:acetyl esterase/lipase